MIEPQDVKRYQRELRAMLMRAGDEDPEGFAAIAAMLTEAQQSLWLAAHLTKAQHGYSWRELARAMDVSTSTLHERFSVTKPTLTGLDDPDTLKALIRASVGDPQ